LWITKLVARIAFALERLRVITTLTIPSALRVEAWKSAPTRKEGSMTERERRAGSGGVVDNVHDELDEAAGQGRGGRTARKEAAPEVEEPPGSGGIKDNVRDELALSQESR
jgi:hypothetical protein